MRPLRVFLLGNDDPSSNQIFRGVLEAGDDVRLVGIAYSKTLVKKKRRYLGTFYLLNKMDFKYWLYLVFWNGIFSLGEFFHVRGMAVESAWTLKASCLGLNIPVFYSEDFNSKEFISYIYKLEPDIIITRANQILKNDLLKIPKFGVWCCHSSLLPSYQGIAAEFHALLNGESRVGSTIFKVESKLDEGPCLYQVETLIEKGGSVYKHTFRNNNAAKLMLSFSLLKLSQERRRPKTMSRRLDIEQSYYSWPRPGRVGELLKCGHKLINGKEIFIHIRRCFFGLKKDLYP